MDRLALLVLRGGPSKTVPCFHEVKTKADCQSARALIWNPDVRICLQSIRTSKYVFLFKPPLLCFSDFLPFWGEVDGWDGGVVVLVGGYVGGLVGM